MQNIQMIKHKLTSKQKLHLSHQYVTYQILYKILRYSMLIKEKR